MKTARPGGPRGLRDVSHRVRPESATTAAQALAADHLREMGAPARAERLVPAVVTRHRGARYCQSDGHDASGIDEPGFLGERAAVALLDRAVIQVLTDRRQLTPDLGLDRDDNNSRRRGAGAGAARLRPLSATGGIS